jgi:manganese/zinc/iron transport system substrate-binding protein
MALARRRATGPAILLVAAVVGCYASSGTTTGDAARNPQLPRVTCTTGMVADLARNVGGEHIYVQTLMGEGVDPHLYTASPDDVSKLRQADLILYSGLHLEGKLAELLERMGQTKATVAVAESIPTDRLLTDEHGARDPHVWFDVALWSETINAVEQALVKLDPDHAEDYRSNAQTYRDRLTTLDAYAREKLSSIPEERRVLVAAHDAFQYFGRAYGVEVRGIQGISTDSEAGIRQVTELVDFLVERKIKAVFVETSVAEGNVASLLEGAAARGHVITIGGTLYSDAMGAERTPAGSYEGMVKHNVDTIVSAL